MKILIKYILIILSIILKKVIFNKHFKKSELSLVNLGCGLHCLPKWVNVDGSLTSLLSTKYTFANKFIYRLAGASSYYEFKDYNRIVSDNKLHWYNLSDGVPFYENSIDIVYTSHFLEHLNKDDGYKFLENIYNSLKEGGVLRVVVPDLDIAIQRFNNNEIDSTQDLFFYTSNDNDFSMHKYNYNFSTLRNKLDQIGFKDIVKMKYREGKCPDIDYLDLYPDHSLYIEAYKA